MIVEQLSKFTDEELKAELKRRHLERLKNMPRGVTYIEFEATIVEEDIIKGKRPDGTCVFKPFAFWKYRIGDCSIENLNNYKFRCYYLRQGQFKRDTAPKVGDRVKLRYRKTKYMDDSSSAKIISIIK